MRSAMVTCEYTYTKITVKIVSANCFCKDGLSPYNTENERGREVPDS